MPDDARIRHDATLRAAWEAEAANWLAWAREPGHDSYWTYHRATFLPSLPRPPARVLDVGCGEGRLPRDLRALGYEVVGLDGSETLVGHARAADPTGTYLVGDAARLPFDAGSFDLVTAFMSLQDVDDPDSAVREIARVLVPGGHARTAIVHPVNSAGGFESTEPAAAFVIRESYFDERIRANTFERDGLRMTFTSRHRPLSAVIRAFLDAGLTIDHVAEIPDLSDPAGSRWRRIPLFLHLGAVKPAAPL